MDQLRTPSGLRAATFRSDLASIVLGLGLAACAWLGSFEGQAWALNLVRFFVWCVVLPVGALLYVLPLTRDAAQSNQEPGVLALWINRGGNAAALLCLAMGGHLLTAMALVVGHLLIGAHRAAVVKVLATNHPSKE